MYHGIQVFAAPQDFQKSLGPEYVRVECLDRRRETRQRVALSCQVKDKIGPAFLKYVLQRYVIAKIAINEMHPVLPVRPLEEMLHVVEGAPPSAHAVNDPVRVPTAVGANDSRAVQELLGWMVPRQPPLK